MNKLEMLKEQRGYRFETDPDGTERMYRPDGSLAVTAKKTNENAKSTALDSPPHTRETQGS